MARNHVSVPDRTVLLPGNTSFNRFPKMLVLLGLLVLLVISLRSYKAHHAGIIHDEFWTLRDFCGNIHSPMTVYTSTNNHILNSLSIVLLRPFFGSYEHYIRIHTVLWGALFCVAIAWILHNVLRSFVIRFVFLLVILLNWYIFDLSYLARGYAIALGMVFACIAVLVQRLSQNNKNLAGWPTTALFVVTNFIAMGSMLSSLSIIVSLNLLYAAILLWQARGQGAKVITRRIYQLIVLVACSGLSLYLLYFRVLSEVRQLSRTFEAEPFFDTMKKVLFDSCIKLNAMSVGQMMFARQVYFAVLFLLACCLAVGLVFLLIRIKSLKTGAFRLTPSVFILVLTGCVFLVKIAQLKLLGMSLGMPRNSVFFLVLVLISSGIVIDHAFNLLARTRYIRSILLSICAVVLGVFIYVNLPSMRAVDVRPYDWGKQSAVGPLVRQLKQIDPNTTWRLNIDGYADCLSGAISYYQMFGYKAQRAAENEGDLFVVREHPAAAQKIYMDYHFFLDFHCAVIVNPTSVRNKPVYYLLQGATPSPDR